MASYAKLVLEDGTVFEGRHFGAKNSKAGEVVFATGMVGYDLSLTDPSYKGQILTFTYPLIGNWGVPPRNNLESPNIQVSGLVISDLTETPSHWQSTKTLDTWLKEEGIPAIAEIDTRKLTQKLRQTGVMLGKIVAGGDVEIYDPNLENLVAQVSVKKLKAWESEGGKSKVKIGLLNCGAKENIRRSLTKRGATVYEMPWDFDPFAENLALDGLVISNGPGDPKMAKESIAIIKKALDKKLPTFGICLGNQLLALAAGGDTYKLKFGHRSQNQPTIQEGTKRCFITTQNHGFAVNEKKLPKGFKRWFYNANDNTNEGIIHEKLPFFSVQFHPEAAPGPTDTEFLFDYFLERVR
ncbi:MAG: glutamine-hydrolyzing carbamoyl-phosphate synthase small subunit [Candidatus Curtissbacteria bacterium]|nr:glutamine-hydrolyzing carbamoyl-phosphate synthase small subunit [Candidatus Curtissbacteria bacterium]